ncbi:hypothetical protein J6590_031899 [Homalodisca vitripennis]|nr:hypothetical protein J6590_031899 [Homalodisca vitripennis]
MAGSNKQLITLNCDMFGTPSLCKRIFKVVVLAYARYGLPLGVALVDVILPIVIRGRYSVWGEEQRACVGVEASITPLQATVPPPRQPQHVPGL